MIQLYEYVTNKYDENFKLQLDYHCVRNVTRHYGKKYKLVPKRCKYELRKQCFVNRVVKLWNMLPDKVVSVNSVSCFEGHLDEFWSDWDVYYNYKCVI